LLTGLHELNMAVSYLYQREGGAHGCAGQLIATAAVLNPITWPEPFGLVMAEALATATPVLAFPNGAAPEIIDHGRTGYLCPGEDEMTAAAARVDQIDRGQCRAAAERRFSLARMAADYARLYRAILEHPGRPAHERTGTGVP